jgi:tRNA (guanosine-2'-O-)-methyltransferase
MPGGGPKYEPMEKAPAPEGLLLDVRRERVDAIVSMRTRNLVVVLDELEDAFNMAAVLRTAEGLGLQEIHVIESAAARFVPNGTVTQGCDKWLDVTRYASAKSCIEGLQARGFRVWASAANAGGEPLEALSFEGKTALVFGNERHGVSPAVLELADGAFWLPMRGFSQSFNISVAAAACLSHAVRRRAELFGPGGDLTPEEAAQLKARFYRLSVKQRAKLYGSR